MTLQRLKGFNSIIMKRLPILLFIFFLAGKQCYSQKAENQIALSKVNQWALNKHKSFLIKHKVRVDTAVVFRLIAKELLDGCNTNCLLGPLIVDGLELEGKRENATSVKLKFHTLSEANNSGFIIERRFENGPLNFDSVGFVRGIGNSNVRSDYTFDDYNLYDKNTFYRLRQVDIDSRYKFSKIIKVDGYSNPFSVSVLPNPTTTGNISILLRGFTSFNNINLLIIDTKGSMVYRKERLPATEGSIFKLQDIHLIPGFYRIKASNENENAYTTFIVR